MLIENNSDAEHKIKPSQTEKQHDELEKCFAAQSDIQTEFVNIAGHEMKTSIQAILTYSELLQNKNDVSREDYVKAILRNALRLKMLSNNLTDLTISDANILKLKKERFNLSTLILSIVEDFKNMNKFHESKTKVVVQSSEHVLVNADVEGLTQVILNILDNAMKFTKNGNITIRLEERQDKNYILTTITDTGPGIDNKIKSNLFNKFTTLSDRGTGLGLYICKNIIEAHGGEIWAENNNSRNGAIVSFKIPINVDHATITNSTKFLSSGIEA